MDYAYMLHALTERSGEQVPYLIRSRVKCCSSMSVVQRSIALARRGDRDWNEKDRYSSVGGDIACPYRLAAHL